ncbi:IS110 family transposase [uncultured Dokdonia sp.]|uniref:IS110 family transposase n=1 Tax=uncultured Dokdonia sp. TaxID=575653 RepID=UPI0026021620|nr:IS110 family transposase [uncultured Dokdonia sp.]
MNKITNYFGIDISKDVFDVVDSCDVHYQFTNCQKGFDDFLDILDESSHCVMESTAFYHVQLANALVQSGIKVSVENPLAVKRYIQMHLSRIKTDKSDAKMICQYAQQADLRLWEERTKDQVGCLQLMSLINQYTKQIVMTKTKLEGEAALGNPVKLVVRSLEKNLRRLKKEVDFLELELLRIVKREHQDLLTRIESIVGIGRKTAVTLIVLTEGFEKFESAKQLCSYAGLTPIIRQSGSSLHVKARISKMGNRRLRSMLFLCSFSAKKHNKACIALFNRMVAKGKPRKVALIAVCNKLLKQAFAIAKSGVPYDREYRSVLH